MKTLATPVVNSENLYGLQLLKKRVLLMQKVIEILLIKIENNSLKIKEYWIQRGRRRCGIESKES